MGLHMYHRFEMSNCMQNRRDHSRDRSGECHLYRRHLSMGIAPSKAHQAPCKGKCTIAPISHLFCWCMLPHLSLSFCSLECICPRSCLFCRLGFTSILTNVSWRKQVLVKSRTNNYVGNGNHEGPRKLIKLREPTHQSGEVCANRMKRLCG